MAKNVSKRPTIEFPPKLTDNYNRQFNYLRISITDRCNLNCIYCAPNPLTPKLSHHAILRYEEILRFVKIAVRLGITKVRITGGEPLVRKEVFHLLGQLTRLEGISDVSLTTNGIYLSENIDRILNSGVKRINISLDTLDSESFHRLTGRNAFSKVWDGIQNAHRAGFFPIKINVVALKGINDHEFSSLARLTFQYPFHIRFIEYMPIGEAVIDRRRRILTPEIKALVEKEGRLIPVHRNMADGPAERYQLEGAMGEIGFISPISHHFCESCNRLRLTADGHIKTCLLSNSQFDIKTALRSGVSDDAISKLLLEGVSHKPHFHKLQKDQDGKITCQMSAIGG